MSIIPKISFSLLALINKYENIEEGLSLLENTGIDMWHYDVSNEKKTLFLNDLPKLKLITKLPFDIHLSVPDPFVYIENLKLSSEDHFCLHVENNISLHIIKQLKKKLECKFGLAIKTETPIEKLFYVAGELDYVLFMASTPGVSGGAFNETVIEKIETFKKIFPNMPIHVDGGVNNMSAGLLRDIGVDVLISGSYLIKDDYAKQLAKLIGINLGCSVNKFMYANNDLPVVMEASSLSEVAKEIDHKKIGCVCVKDLNNKFLGLITDTDIRRSVINHSDLTKLTASTIMNRNPFISESEISIIDLIHKIENIGTFFTVVPVVNTNNECIGIIRLQDILFHKLISFRVRTH